MSQLLDPSHTNESGDVIPKLNVPTSHDRVFFHASESSSLPQQGGALKRAALCRTRHEGTQREFEEVPTEMKRNSEWPVALSLEHLYTVVSAQTQKRLEFCNIECNLIKEIDKRANKTDVRCRVTA